MEKTKSGSSQRQLTALQLDSIGSILIILIAIPIVYWSAVYVRETVDLSTREATMYISHRRVSTAIHYLLLVCLPLAITLCSKLPVGMRMGVALSGLLSFLSWWFSLAAMPLPTDFFGYMFYLLLSYYFYGAVVIWFIGWMVIKYPAAKNREKKYTFLSAFNRMFWLTIWALIPMIIIGILSIKFMLTDLK